jgi:hypothetical protein
MIIILECRRYDPTLLGVTHNASEKVDHYLEY